MYHIKRDKRSQASAMEIGKGLMQLLKTMPLSEVTVSDIHRATGVSRMTFYRYFDTPDDVLSFLCEQQAKYLANYYETHEVSDIHELVKNAIRLSIAGHELQEVLVYNHRMDLLNEMYAVHIGYIRDKIPALRDLDQITYDYVRSLLYAAITNVFSTWVRRGKTETPEQLFQYIKVHGNIISHVFDTESEE